MKKKIIILIALYLIIAVTTFLITVKSIEENPIQHPRSVVKFKK